MAQRGIREYDAKRLLARILPDTSRISPILGELALVGPETDLEELEAREPWLKTSRLVVKPDQLFGKEGQAWPGCPGCNLARGGEVPAGEYGCRGHSGRHCRQADTFPD